MFHIEGESRGVGGRKPRNVEYTKTEDGHYVGTVIHGDKTIEFLIDEDDLERVKTRNWHAVVGGKYIGSTIVINDERKTLYLHNLIMNKLDFPGRGAKESVDHINRNGLDNRKSNLRVVTQSIQNTNQKKKKRTADLPDGFTDLPKHIWYIKSHGAHGDRFCVELKTEGISRKTSSSKKLTLQEKFKEALKIREELYEQYPYLRSV